MEKTEDLIRGLSGHIHFPLIKELKILYDK